MPFFFCCGCPDFRSYPLQDKHLVRISELFRQFRFGKSELPVQAARSRPLFISFTEGGHGNIPGSVQFAERRFQEQTSIRALSSFAG